MKKNLVLLAAVTIALGAASVLAVDKSTVSPAAAPATDAPAAPVAADKTATAKKQTICPKCKQKIEKKFYVDYDGKRIYCCSSFCVSKTKKDIAGVVSKLEADGITLDTVEKKADKKK